MHSFIIISTNSFILKFKLCRTVNQDAAIESQQKPLTARRGSKHPIYHSDLYISSSATFRGRFPKGLSGAVSVERGVKVLLPVSSVGVWGEVDVGGAPFVNFAALAGVQSGDGARQRHVYYLFLRLNRRRVSCRPMLGVMSAPSCSNSFSARIPSSSRRSNRKRLVAMSSSLLT